MSRPELLFPLFAGLETLPGIGPRTAQNLGKMGVTAPRDLLFTLPYALIDRRLRASVQDVELPATVTVAVTVGDHRPPRSRSRPYQIVVEDAQLSFLLVFFHARGDYLRKTLPTGSRRIVSGRVELFDGMAQMAHPEFILPEAEAESVPAFEPVYPLTAGVTQKQMFKGTQASLDRLPPFEEWIAPSQMQHSGWPDAQTALRQAHAPQHLADVTPTAPARERLAYDELLAHQMTLALARQHASRGAGRSTSGDGRLQTKVRAHLPFAPTGAQERALQDIQADLAALHRMNRLLQGDVGSGKTLVAFLAMLASVEAGGQAVMMAPTEILARQHLEGLQPLAESAGVVLELLTGRDKGRERQAKMSALQAGDIQILVGTHAVFQSDVSFRDLRLAIIDEQHRFGVRQRLELGKKGAAVDVLVMTATPIPRSLALSHYGDMDVSVLDEKPPGRQPITTALVSTERMDEVVGRLQAAIAEGRQCYWVCPLVEESEVSDLIAAEERFKRLRAALGEGRVGLVHGQMPPAEKDAAMHAFQNNETQVLVATTVIEVGVNVPNATIMVIERAETFGLAQLHQLRGRVGRGSAASTCLLMYQAPLKDTAKRRLEVLRETEDGFRISEVDLELRGYGDLIGTAQSGVPKFKVADLERQSGLMEIAQSDARALLAEDPDLTTKRGRAARVLLWLMRQDEAIKLIAVG